LVWLKSTVAIADFVVWCIAVLSEPFRGVERASGKGIGECGLSESTTGDQN
jgi:hypothetical protein